MSLISESKHFSQIHFHSVINQLKRKNNCLKTDLIRFKSLSNCYQKYFDYFNEINETIDSNKEVLKLKNNIKVLKECRKSCFISLNKLNESSTKRKSIKTQNI